MSLQNILPNIEGQLVPTKEGRQERGEVFTPPFFIDELFNRLPSAIWKDPTKKWIDPAGGVGNFLFVAYYRLDKGLATVLPSPTKRRRHILENMLFMIELDPENVRIAKSIFKKIDPTVTPNILQADALIALKESTFDVVMGNPPFNKGHRHEEGVQRSFLEQFVRSSLTALKENGYLCFVMPQTWRNVHNPIYSMFRSIDLQHLVVIREGFYEYPMDLLVARNRPYHGKTRKEFLPSTGKPTTINIQTATRITNGDDSLFERAVRLGKRYGTLPIQVVSRFNISSPQGKTFMSVRPSRTHRYPIVRNLNRHGLAPENIVYSSIPHPAQTALKVLISNGSYLYPHIDSSHGTSQNVYFVLRSSKKEAEQLVTYFLSDIIRTLFEILKVGHYGSDYRDMALLPDPAKLPTSELDSFLALCKKYECVE
jgi:predicted RNA methylase